MTAPDEISHPDENQTGTAVAEPEQQVKLPRQYRVLLHNDNYTPMDFVVMILKSIFHMNDTRAMEIMLHVHERGVGIAGVFSADAAATKVAKVATLARDNQFPLRASMEPEP